MEIQIKNPLNGNVATVSSFNRLNVSAKTNPRLFYASRDEAQSFNAISDTSNAATGTYVHYLKNTSKTKNLFVKHIEFHSVNAAKWKIWHVTGTATGTDVVPSNLNLGSGLLAETECKGNGSVTGLSNIKQIGVHRNDALGEGAMEYDDSLLISPEQAIAIEYIGATGDVETDIFFHFETIGAK